MPWPMIHFSIEYRYCENNPSPSFVLGNVAPDTILVRENCNKEEKVRFHLGRNPTQDDFVNFVKANAELKNFDDGYVQFLLGYIAHIIADLKWSELKNQVSNDNRSLRNRLWQEENQMDFNLYRNVKWREQVIKDTMRSQLYKVSGLYSSEELDLWRKKIFNWYEQSDNEPNMNNEYVTLGKVDEFVENLIEELNELYKDLRM